MGESAGGLGERGDAQIDRGGAAGGDLLHLGELVVGAGQADLESFGFAEPPVGLGLSDPREQVVADLDQTLALGGVRSQQRASQTRVLVDARRRVGAAAVAEGDLAAFEVAEEFVPFLVGRLPVFLTWGLGGGR